MKSGKNHSQLKWVSTKKRVIFLSHSSENQDEAKIIYDFLNYIIGGIPKFRNLYEVFFAPISLPKSIEDSTWQDTLIREVAESYSFISYCTPNSITSRWSNFEIGVAYDKIKRSSDKNTINIAPLASSCMKMDIGRSILESKVIHFKIPYHLSLNQSKNQLKT